MNKKNYSILYYRVKTGERNLFDSVNIADTQKPA
jgi:hypothetical protein